MTVIIVIKTSFRKSHAEYVSEQEAEQLFPPPRLFKRSAQNARLIKLRETPPNALTYESVEVDSS
jgi:hypothetical protein